MDLNPVFGTEEWLSVLPGRTSTAELTPQDLLDLTDTSEVLQAGATVEPRYGQDASGGHRVRLLVSHTQPETVARTRDAPLRQGRRLGLRVFLV
ncbi:hypothetical protein Q0M94_00085 [Deinococcus radiomollis]|uniref:hypothetical protein n=1 Tax=Deinococcus radiomollis TaxID=468916 RepID=UPI0038915984